jgi:hypothetical protein
MAQRNTFFKTHGKAGSTYKCDVCGRGTRNTGVQSVGSGLCPQCYDLAGIENEISDGYATRPEKGSEILRLTSEIAAKGGSLSEWADLLNGEPV